MLLRFAAFRVYSPLIEQNGAGIHAFRQLNAKKTRSRLRAGRELPVSSKSTG